MHIAILRRRRNFVVYSVTVFLHLLFVISPEMIHKSSQMSARASVRVVSTQHFQNPRLLDRWANVDETRHIYSVGREQNLGSGILANLGPCAARCHPELNPVGRDDPPLGIGCFLDKIVHEVQRTKQQTYNK